jgi:hypothetical protein
MFLFGITTIIFMLSTIVIVLGPGLRSQGIHLIVKTIDPSLDRFWSLGKINVVSAVITVISRLIVRFPTFLHLVPCCGIT